jgi:RNA polymerase sigma-70 factor, ECF subfamily
MDRREWVDGVFRAHSTELYRYLRTFRLSEEETYDLVQDSFVKLLDFEPSQIRQPKVWLFAVGRNQAINARRRNGRRAESRDVEGLFDPSPGALGALLEDEERRMLWEALQRLPGAQQEMLVLYLEHELNYGQIAKVLGRSELAVRVAMHRCRGQLRKELHSVDGRYLERSREEGSE